MYTCDQTANPSSLRPFTHKNGRFNGFHKGLRPGRKIEIANDLLMFPFSVQTEMWGFAQRRAWCVYHILTHVSNDDTYLS